MSLTIREATVNDASVLAELMTQLGYPSTEDEMLFRLENIFKHPDYKTLVVETENEVAGAIGMVKNLLWEQNGCYVKIQALVVKNSNRKSGIGKLLIEAAEIWAIEIGAIQLALTSGNREEREAAHQFYPKMGFQLTSSGYKKMMVRPHENG